MYLTNLKLWNFRIFGSSNPFDIDKPNLSLDFKNGINVLIGENDSGKTAIIDAIKLVLKTHSGEWIKVEEEDFHKEAERMRIEMCFKGFNPEEAKYFTEWLDWEDDGKSGHPSLTVYYDNTTRDGKIVPTDIKAGAFDSGHLLTAEAKTLLRTTYLRPLRDAKAELSSKRNSRLSQILFSHDSFADKKGHRFVNLVKQLNVEVDAYFKGKDAAGADLQAADLVGKDVKDTMDTYLKQFSKKSTHFKMTDSDLKSILETLSLLFEDGHNLGLGSHNLLCIASELLHLKKKNWEGLRLGLIEEIEAHLHPQVQLLVVQTLRAQAESMQLIFTTHSPNIGSKIPLENLILCSDGKAFPLDDKYTELDPKDYKFLEIFLDTTKANLFFSKGVILVEGWAEELLVPALAKVIGVDLTENGVSIINVGSTAYLRFSKIFQRKADPQIEIPVSIITDVDIRTYTKELKLDANGKPVKDVDGKNEYDYIKRDAKTVAEEITAKVSKIDISKGNIKYFLAPEWTLEYALFKSSAITSVFQEIVKKIHSKTDWADFEKALANKLINKTLDKTEIAYQMANKLQEFLELDPGCTAAPLADIKNPKAGDHLEYLIKAIKHAGRN